MIKLVRCIHISHLQHLMQMSLAAARKSLAPDNHAGEPGRNDALASPRCYDSEDGTSMGSRTPGASTPLKFSNLIPDIGAGKEANGSLTAVNSLTKEFDQRRQTFDDDVKALVEVKVAPHPPSNNVNHHPDEDLRKLKLRFETWKKDYKSRLREAKARLQKNGDGDKSRRKWWGKISARVS